MNKKLVALAGLIVLVITGLIIYSIFKPRPELMLEFNEKVRTGMISYLNMSATDRERIWSAYKVHVSNVSPINGEVSECLSYIDPSLTGVQSLIIESGFNLTSFKELISSMSESDKILACVTAAMRGYLIFNESIGFLDSVQEYNTSFISEVITSFLTKANSVYNRTLMSKSEISYLITELVNITGGQVNFDNLDLIIEKINEAVPEVITSDLLDYLNCRLLAQSEGFPLECEMAFRIRSYEINELSKVVLSMPKITAGTSNYYTNFEPHNEYLIDSSFETPDPLYRVDAYDDFNISLTGVNASGLTSEWLIYNTNNSFHPTGIHRALTNVTIKCNPDPYGLRFDFFNPLGINLTSFYSCDNTKTINLSEPINTTSYDNGDYAIFLACKDANCYKLEMDYFLADDYLTFKSLTNYLIYSINYLN